MTTTVPPERKDSVERSVRRYRGFLVLYPRTFRAEYGEDLVQSYRDLFLFSEDRRGLWWRTARDLVSSAVRQRAGMLSEENRPSAGAIVAGVAAVLALLVIGTPGLLLLPALVLIILPCYGLSRFWYAWSVRRKTGGPVARHILLGLASIAPAAILVAVLGSDLGYWIFIAVASTAIISAGAGILWAVVTVLRRPEPGRRRRWVAPAMALVPCIAVLGFIIGASLNSYLNSLGPPGDHSVENASAESRALWEAAGAGQLDEVTRITTETCADPWVKFPVGTGRHNAKGYAEAYELRGNGDLSPFYPKISDILGDYQDDWYDRCAQSAG
jgi:hypothetical protein